MSDSTLRQIETKPTPRLGVPTMSSARPLRVRIHGPAGEPLEVDLTHTLTQAIAHELWRLHQGNSVVNWMQAEAIVDHLADAVEAQRAPAMQAEAKPMAPARLAA